MNERIDAIETSLLGAPIKGGLLDRVKNLEEQLFGEAKNGALPDRVSALETASGSAECEQDEQDEQAECEQDEQDEQDEDTVEPLVELNTVTTEQIEEGRNDETKRLNFLVLGQIGAGKSTTINCLLESGIKEGDTTKSTKCCTKDPELYKGFLYDRPAGVIDQAGFGDADGLDDAEILARTLMYVATKVDKQKLDAYLIVQSLEAEKSHVTHNIGLVKKVFGDAAAKKTIVLLTKGERLIMPDNPRFEGEKAEAIKRCQQIQREIVDACGGKEDETHQLLWFNNFDRDKYVCKDVLKHFGFKKQDKHLFYPMMRLQIQRHCDSFASVQDHFPKQLAGLVERVGYEVRKHHGAVETPKLFEGAPTSTIVIPERTEAYYDPTLLSRIAAFGTLSVSYFCGADHSTRTIPAQYIYSEERKHFAYTFSQTDLCFGVSLGTVVGDGAVENVEHGDDKKSIKFTIKTTGPVTPRVTAYILSSPPGEIHASNVMIGKAMCENFMFTDDNGIRQARSLEDLRTQLLNHFCPSM